ncbi:MAG: N-acetylmuramoyl-L-alanine amidase [Calothrix sp. SM1_5_4]|nr:N-acetylmuramoyl-L-alanine amidase [Calothrix sp. SM1_5_4]
MSQPTARIVSASSPNFSAEVIPVEFVVLHYTAADLRRTLRIFADRACKVCAHFVLDTDGTIYDLGGFWDGDILKGAHAGVSRIEIDGTVYTSLNSMSIGVEIVNLNGNLFPYTDAQYASLETLLAHLLRRFPNLSRPCRILGHETIGRFAGKCDPGVLIRLAPRARASGANPPPESFYPPVHPPRRGLRQGFSARRTRPGRRGLVALKQRARKPHQASPIPELTCSRGVNPR